VTALRLHGVTIADANHHPVAGDGGQADGGLSGPVSVSLIPFRDLCAVVSEQKAFALADSSQDSIIAHRAVIDSVFRNAPVLPAPVGVVFRTPDVIKRWMELHYVSLSDALAFVEDRAVARVHILRADGKPDELEAGSDLAAAAAESLRALRRKAAASVPLRLEEVTGLALSAAFLVDRELWREFQVAVDEQRDAHQRLQFDVTGPWAPYDFVRMQFGG
jgi:hypothetical protein